MTEITAIPSRDLFAVCATLDCAHEPDDLERANAALVQWGITHDEAVQELIERGCIKE